MLTLEILIRSFGVAIVLWIIGMFTQKKLNPRYEELIEKRMNRVGHLAFAAISCVLLISVFLDIWQWRTKSEVPAPVLFSSFGLILLVLGVCSYLISRLKGQGGWQSIVWAIFGATGTGLLALLLCANYYPVGEPPDFPIYRGRKIRFICESCGRHLSDYECNAGTEGVCPKCGNNQIVPTLKGSKDESTKG
ncbi:MAG: hypothetical protein OEW48_16625 [Phycisphaerae bacterium]|nr:hypothetical protein [Phycisphaerae bacterium]